MSLRSFSSPSTKCWWIFLYLHTSFQFSRYIFSFFKLHLESIFCSKPAFHSLRTEKSVLGWSVYASPKKMHSKNPIDFLWILTKKISPGNPYTISSLHVFFWSKKDAILPPQRCIPPKQKESLNQHRIISMLIKGLPLFTNYICTLSWPKMHFILLLPAPFLPHCFSAYVSLCASQVLLWWGHRWSHYHWGKAHLESS